MDGSGPLRSTPARMFASFLVALSMAAGPAVAEELVHGGDLYVAGEDAQAPRSSDRNLFLASGDARLKEAVARNAHVAGFDVEVDAPVGGDLYTAGAFVDVDAAIGGDVSAAGFRLRLGQPETVIGGNVRAAGRTVVVDGTISGAALVAAERLQLNGVVKGDLRFAGRTIAFGPDARVGGILTAQTPYEPNVPASVASSDRVRHEVFSPSDFAEKFGKGAGEALGLEAPPWWLIAGAIAAFFVGLVVLGVLFLGLAPQTVEGLREDAEARVWRSLGYGLIGLSTLLGLVPLAIITVVGMPLIPLILLVAACLAVFAYLLGAYALAHRVFRSSGARHTTMAGRLRTFVIGLLVLLLLNAVPFIGWLINALAALAGFGALEMRLVNRLGRPSAAASAPPGKRVAPPASSTRTL